MIAFPVYIYFHGPYFLPILMGFVLPICGPFLFFHYYLPFRTHVIPYAQPWRGRIPPYHDLYNRPVLSYSFICLHLTRRPLLIAMSSRQIGGIERPFPSRTYHGHAHVDQSSVFRLKKQPVQQETHRVRSEFLLAVMFHPSLCLTSKPSLPH